MGKVFHSDNPVLKRENKDKMPDMLSSFAFQDISQRLVMFWIFADFFYCFQNAQCKRSIFLFQLSDNIVKMFGNSTGYDLRPWFCSVSDITITITILFAFYWNEVHI